MVVDADGLTDAQLQELARWTNLSETTFLLSPDSPKADYRVRIFTLAGELPFAGHPTLGSCHAWLTLGGQPRHDGVIVQECAAGLVRLTRRDDRLAFGAPARVRSGPLEEESLEAILGRLRLRREDVIDAQWADNGPGWMALLLRDAEAVLAVEPSFDRMPAGASLDVGLVGLYPVGSECAIEVRGLFSDERGVMREDPVTGSLNASVAQWLLETRRLEAPYVASQGSMVGHEGRVHVDRDEDGTVWVGGATLTCISGTIDV